MDDVRGDFLGRREKRNYFSMRMSTLLYIGPAFRHSWKSIDLSIIVKQENISVKSIPTYIVKLGCAGVYLFFSYFCSKTLIVGTR